MVDVLFKIPLKGKKTHFENIKPNFVFGKKKKGMICKNFCL